jgi:DNA-binding beta-propeller fold protein YncE
VRARVGLVAGGLVAAGVIVWLLAVSAGAMGDGGGAQAVAPDGAVLYVANEDGTLRAYQEGSWTLIGRWNGLPFTAGIRGTAFDGSALFFAVGGDGGAHGNGSLVKWDLTTDTVVFDVAYPFGVDQLNACGGSLYIPVGEGATTARTWQRIDESTGAVMGSVQGGLGPHNTLCVDGHWYFGGRYDDYLYQSAGPKIGPSPSSVAGVRPFTVGRGTTRAWITWTDYRGFSIADTATGQILDSVNFGSLPPDWSQTTASHGITVDPANSAVYVLDMTQNAVRAYTTADSPTLLATIPLDRAIYNGFDSPCAYDCAKVGWLQHSVNGAYVFVGESGDVINTATRRIVTYLPPLANTRHGFIDVLWRNSLPVSGNHFGYGH